MQQIHHVQAAERALTRLAYPTIAIAEAVPTVMRAIVLELREALSGMEQGDLEAIPAIAGVWGAEEARDDPGAETA